VSLCRAARWEGHCIASVGKQKKGDRALEEGGPS
jgi:hypothetical protein